jgi:hypothetical protein
MHDRYTRNKKYERRIQFKLALINLEMHYNCWY